MDLLENVGQFAAATNKEINTHIPNYVSLLPQLLCQLHSITMYADVETDEIYAQMTLQPLTSVPVSLIIWLSISLATINKKV
ncbi:auxin response factor 6-like isoform X1, partial [Olea europaea subsp. europaea]